MKCSIFIFCLCVYFFTYDHSNNLEQGNLKINSTSLKADNITTAKTIGPRGPSPSFDDLVKARPNILINPINPKACACQFDCDCRPPKNIILPGPWPCNCIHHDKK